MKKVDKDSKALQRKKSKKEQKELNKLNRVLVPMNTGTRTHDTDKKYNRRNSKKDLRKRLTDND